MSFSNVDMHMDVWEYISAISELWSEMRLSRCDLYFAYKDAMHEVLEIVMFFKLSIVIKDAKIKIWKLKYLLIWVEEVVI